MSEREQREQVERGESREPILAWFAYEHLPARLQRVSRLFADVAHELEATLPRCAERSVALRKLLEGKDAAVRAELSREEGEKGLTFFGFY